MEPVMPEADAVHERTRPTIVAAPESHSPRPIEAAPVYDAPCEIGPRTVESSPVNDGPGEVRPGPIERGSINDAPRKVGPGPVKGGPVVNGPAIDDACHDPRAVNKGGSGDDDHPAHDGIRPVEDRLGR